MKLLLQLSLVIIISVSTVAAFFYSQKQTYSSVELDSYVENEVSEFTASSELLKLKPVSEQEIIDAIVSTTGPITVSGVHHSLGGKITYLDSLYLDLSDFNQVLALDTDKKLIRVQTGISWRQIQRLIDPHNLSVKIMPDYNDFSVGGSLSTNAHGRFAGLGSIINSVKSIRIILANGKVYEASPETNNALFYGAIGGFGGVGVIVEATLELVDNIALERSVKSLPFYAYNNYVKSNILGNDNIVLNQAIFYPPSYESLLNINWLKTDKALTDERRLQENAPELWWESVLMTLKSTTAILHRFQKNLIDPFTYKEAAVVTRNFATSHSLRESGLINSKKETMVMQEYRVPLNRFEIFAFNLRDVFSRHDADIYKILVSYLPQDHAGHLNGAVDNVYSFKIIYLQKKNEESMRQVESWTAELVRASIESNGVHILPYLIQDTAAQLYRAYPDLDYLFELKKKTDPVGRFTNLFWEQHNHSEYAGSNVKKNMQVKSSAL